MFLIYLLFDDRFAELTTEVLDEGKLGATYFVGFNNLNFFNVWGAYGEYPLNTNGIGTNFSYSKGL